MMSTKVRERIVFGIDTAAAEGSANALFGHFTFLATTAKEAATTIAKDWEKESC